MGVSTTVWTLWKLVYGRVSNYKAKKPQEDTVLHWTMLANLFGAVHLDYELNRVKCFTCT